MMDSVDTLVILSPDVSLPPGVRAPGAPSSYLLARDSMTYTSAIPCPGEVLGDPADLQS